MNDRSPATDILLDAAARHEATSWLVPGGGAALALGLAADQPGATIHWQPVDVRERDAASPLPANLHLLEPGAVVSDLEAVALAAPPDRDLARRWLLVARQTLGRHGRLFLAGANAEGIRSAIADAGKLFGLPLRESYGAKQRVAVFGGDAPTAGLPAWAGEPGIAPGTWAPFTLEVAGKALSLVTQAGVFAGARLDAGTRLLLEALPDRVDGQVLDLGCGAGVIGIAAAHLGAEVVDMTDANLLAAQAARENVSRLDLAGARVLAGDVYAAIGDARYDLIVSNPPFHRGKAVDFSVADRLISGAPAHLAPGGSLLVVANAFLAYGRRMERVFDRVETVRSTRQYHVIQAGDPRSGP